MCLLKTKVGVSLKHAKPSDTNVSGMGLTVVVIVIMV